MLPVPDTIKEEMRVACLEEYEAKRAAEEKELESSPSEDLIPTTESDTSDPETETDTNDLPDWARTEPSSPVRECEACECEACSCEGCEACDQIKLNAEEK